MCMDSDRVGPKYWLERVDAKNIHFGFDALGRTQIRGLAHRRYRGASALPYETLPEMIQDRESHSFRNHESGD